ncbi:MAG: hypothetical protein E5V81_21110, partial [Mesorhizobium sp.]
MPDQTKMVTHHMGAVHPNEESFAVNATAGNLEALEASLLAEIAAASDEAAIEAVRVSALG